MVNRWEKLGYSINNRPDIIGTLYSTGLFYSDGKERKPNANPKANEFGEKVKSKLIFLQTCEPHLKDEVHFSEGN